MAGFFMQWGEIMSNLIYALILGLLLFSAIRRLVDAHLFRAERSLCVTTIIFCLLIYCLWITSCFWKTDTLANPYYWFDFLLTASFPFFLPATRRAVDA